jgi:hypothetical protein
VEIAKEKLVTDKKGEWSENLDHDQVCLLKEQIEEVHVNAQKRSWSHEDAKKELLGWVLEVFEMLQEVRKRKQKKKTGYPSSVLKDIEGLSDI